VDGMREFIRILDCEYCTLVLRKDYTLNGSAAAPV
jgi:hypothetical protein